MEKQDGDNYQKLCAEFTQSLKTFIKVFHEIQTNKKKAHEAAFLEKTAEAVNKLYHDSIQVSQSNHEEAEEIGQVISHIFVQPLSIKSKSTTLIDAASCYKEKKSNACDLTEVMAEYANHPEEVKTFITQLSVLQEEIEDILKKAS